MENFKASLTASIASVLLFTPFDTLRTQMCISEGQKTSLELFKKIVANEGIKGLYRGVGVSLMTTPISTSLYLSLYENIKSSCSLFDSSQLTSKALASISTGAIVNTITNPLWLLKAKIQSQAGSQGKANIKGQIKDIYKSQGIKGYYKGLGISYLGLAHVGIYFSLYEELNRNYIQFQQTQFNTDKYEMNCTDIFLTSSVAKLASIFATYPTNLLTIRFQCMENKAQSSLKTIAKQIYTNNGIKGFFAGMKIETMRSIPANAITFIIYEQMRIGKLAL